MIIINPNNFSSISSSISGSLSGSIHGEFIGLVNESNLSGSFTGSFSGVGTGSFSTGLTQLRRLEGDARDVNSIFHFISSSTGEVSGGYESAIKFMSLADVNNVYRGLEISGEDINGTETGNLITGWLPAGGASPTTKIHFRISPLVTLI